MVHVSTNRNFCNVDRMKKENQPLDAEVLPLVYRNHFPDFESAGTFMKPSPRSSVFTKFRHTLHTAAKPIYDIFVTLRPVCALIYVNYVMY